MFKVLQMITIVLKHFLLTVCDYELIYFSHFICFARILRLELRPTVLETVMLPITIKPVYVYVDETGFEPVLPALQTGALPTELFIHDV
jgi:hypothetical protein